MLLKQHSQRKLTSCYCISYISTHSFRRESVGKDTGSSFLRPAKCWYLGMTACRLEEGQHVSLRADQGKEPGSLQETFPFLPFRGKRFFQPVPGSSAEHLTFLCNRQITLPPLQKGLTGQSQSLSFCLGVWARHAEAAHECGCVTPELQRHLRQDIIWIQHN